MRLFGVLLGIALGQQCGTGRYQMTPGIIDGAKGNYKSEWDTSEDPSLPEVPDYEEIFIYDQAPVGRSSDTDTNPINGTVGDFENPEFWDMTGAEEIDGGRFTGGMNSGPSGIGPIARIVGGQVARPFSHPWQVRVRACSGFACTRMCGGTLVSSQFVVTAAHCLPPFAQSGIITLGAHEYFGPGAVNISIAEIYPHPGWDKKQRTNYIAVIRLERPVQFNHKIQPACLPNKDSCFPAGTACVASGWGYIEEGGPRSNLLREVAVRLMTTAHCNKPGYYNGKILEGMLCAGYNEGARDACTGDSGGPLVCPLPNGKWVLAGATSWGVGCARHQRPGVYTDVRQFSDWIGSIIKEFPDVVGDCPTKGVTGFGAGRDWSFLGTVPRRPPAQMLFDTSGGKGLPNKPPSAPSGDTHDLMDMFGEPVKKPTTTKRTTTTTTTTTTTKKTTTTPVDDYNSLSDYDERLNQCNGLKGKAKKKCIKKLAKKMKANKKDKKKNKKKKKSQNRGEFEMMSFGSRKEKRAYRRQMRESWRNYGRPQEEEEVRDSGFDVDVSAPADDNALFAGWDFN